MGNGYALQITNRIKTSEAGSIFVSSDFADIADNMTVRQNLKRLTETGMIRRVINGVYERPKYSYLLNEYVATNPDAVAKALARRYHWTISPCGDAALNLLGLSTQAVVSWSYVSDGPYKKYTWGTTTLEFKHRTNKEINGLSKKSILVIQALKTLGKDNVTQATIRMIADRLTEADKATLLQEARGCTNWIYSIIRKVADRDIGKIAILPKSDRQDSSLNH